MSAEDVAKAFVQHFYNSFDTNVEGLAGLYVSVDVPYMRGLTDGVNKRSYLSY